MWERQTGGLEEADIFGQYEGTYAREDIIRLIPVSDRVLDVGCAGGQTGEKLKANGIVREVWGVEIYEPACRIAEQRLDHVICADADELELPARHFDGMICADLLEHLKNPQEFLERARDWLVPGGWVATHIPNVAHYSVICNLLGGRWDYTPEGIQAFAHLRFFARPNVVALFESAGYEIETMFGAAEGKLLERYRSFGYWVLARRN
jgi:2-polyprenyl-3-methyl-5-hydroxy-6-metoxy-1,4-benzoquinol methylase